jgi:hypothetical protein
LLGGSAWKKVPGNRAGTRLAGSALLSYVSATCATETVAWIERVNTHVATALEGILVRKQQLCREF